MRRALNPTQAYSWVVKAAPHLTLNQQHTPRTNYRLARTVERRKIS